MTFLHVVSTSIPLDFLRVENDDTIAVSEARFSDLWFLWHPADVAFDQLVVSISGNDAAPASYNIYEARVQVVQWTKDQMRTITWRGDDLDYFPGDRVRIPLGYRDMLRCRSGSTIDSYAPVYLKATLSRNLLAGDRPSWLSGASLNVSLSLAVESIE